MPTPAFPIPLGAPSNVPAFFAAMYEAFSSDPLPAPGLSWSVPSGCTAVLGLGGSTATLALSAPHKAPLVQQMNLACSQTQTRPTVSDVQSWISAAFSTYFASIGSSTVALVGPIGARSALVLVEGIYAAPTTIPYTTSDNYALARVVGLFFDLLNADLANVLAHTNISGANGFWLDWIGNFYDIERLQNTTTYPAYGSSEGDDSYRRRVARTLIQPYDNNVAIASALQQQLNIAGASVVDYAAPSQSGVFVLDLSQPPVITAQQIVSLVNTYRAPGTILGAISVVQPQSAFVLRSFAGENASSAAGASAAVSGSPLVVPGTEDASSAAGATAPAPVSTLTLNGMTRLYANPSVTL